MRRSAISLAALAVFLLVPSAAMAAGLGAPAPSNRAPLPAQTYDGPTLHPSGNDRYVENGGSGTQGKAAHDPDGDYNYGVDQAGGTGGLYLIDQDGNNGCGNDQDFEDDNNGRCGGVRICVVFDTSSSRSGALIHHPRWVICDADEDTSISEDETTPTGDVTSSDPTDAYSF